MNIFSPTGWANSNGTSYRKLGMVRRAAGDSLVVNFLWAARAGECIGGIQLEFFFAEVEFNKRVTRL